MLCSDTKNDKRSKLLDVANELMDLWIEDTRDAESRILVIAHDAQDAQLLQDWINNDFDFAPHMATCIHDNLDPFKIDLSLKMFYYNPPPPPKELFGTYFIYIFNRIISNIIRFCISQPIILP